MAPFTHPLDRISIAKPCSARWEDMSGDERARFCHQCQLKVYNLSSLSREEAESLLTKKEGRVCVRFYRRADGTVLTQDCPVGLAAFKRRMAAWAAAVASVLLTLMTLLGVSFLRKKARPLQGAVFMGDVAPPPGSGPTGPAFGGQPGGGVAPTLGEPAPLMGKVAPKD